jgi:hypothetical protein
LGQNAIAISVHARKQGFAHCVIFGATDQAIAISVQTGALGLAAFRLKPVFHALAHSSFAGSCAFSLRQDAVAIAIESIEHRGAAIFAMLAVSVHAFTLYGQHLGLADNAVAIGVHPGEMFAGVFRPLIFTQGLHFFAGQLTIKIFIGGGEAGFLGGHEFGAAHLAILIQISGWRRRDQSGGSQKQKREA